MRYFFSMLVLLVISSSLFSQSQITISGTVQDSLTHEPLSFSYVTVNGFALGTVTNGEGEFLLNIPIEHGSKSIIFSYLGYKRKIVTVQELQKMKPLLILMNEDVTRIGEVVIKPRKKVSAKQLLRKVVSNIEQNYHQTPVIFEGYYRESIRENGAFISYSDAVAEIHYAPYQKKEYKYADYRFDALRSISSLSNSNFYNGKSLHRGHFHNNTVNTDQAKVIDCRSSDNITKTDMYANVQAGPMGIFSKDYLKYKAAFFSDKKFKKFDFELGEVLLKGVGYVYVLSFKTQLTKEYLEELGKKGRLKPFYKVGRNKVLQGKIYIDRDDFAVLKFESSVPAEFRKYFCSYTTMNYKHFDYKLNVEYQKIGDKYYLKYLRHEDEFILKDTLTNNTTPYTAVSQFWINSVRVEGVEQFDATKVFANLSTNQLFDLPLEYDSTYWANYTANNVTASIPDSIKKDLEVEKPIQQQFADKHKRDDSLKPPLAKRIPTNTTLHKTTLVDDYAWLKQPKDPLSNPEIKAHLMKENEYTDNYFIPLRKSQRELFTELVSRQDKEDESIPYEKDGYWYQTIWTEEDSYPIYMRKKEGEDLYDTLMDVNEMAKGKDYYSVMGYTISPSANIMAYSENTTGSSVKGVVKFKNLETNQLLKDSMLNVSNFIWLNEGQIIYTRQEPKTNRTYQVLVHTINAPQKNDSLLYQENDFRFSINLKKSKSKEYLYLYIGSTNTNEVWFMNVKSPAKGFQLITARQGKHKYSVQDYKNEFYISSNINTSNYEIFKCGVDAYSKDNWLPFMQPSKGNILRDFIIFDNYWVIDESENMEGRLKVIEKEGGKSHYIKEREKIHQISAGYNPRFDSDTIRYSTSSMKSPSEVWNYNLKTHEKRLVKKQEVKNYFRSNWIKNKLVWAEAKDGTKIPITLLYRNYDVAKKNEYKRMFMRSYGSYGIGSEPVFNSTVYSLIYRGFIYAIPHVRGGGELGSTWHEEGKMMNKMNTFTDFIDCADFLIEEGYATKGNIVAQGGSAGGLLMGAIANMRPDLFKLIIADVPFVDVMNTMLDDKLPLTTIEYEEWGNPNEKKAFEYMLKYSPYDNVKTQDYPHMLFTTGINDSQVGYWEPAKMVAKLRQQKTDSNLLFLKTNMNAGHGGGSGRYDYLRDLAYKYAVIFDIFAKDIQEEAAEKAKLEKNGK